MFHLPCFFSKHWCILILYDRSLAETPATRKPAQSSTASMNQFSGRKTRVCPREMAVMNYRRFCARAATGSLTGLRMLKGRSMCFIQSFPFWHLPMRRTQFWWKHNINYLVRLPASISNVCLALKLSPNARGVFGMTRASWQESPRLQLLRCYIRHRS